LPELSWQKTTYDPPSKFVSTEVEVQLACRLLFVDMEGLNDGRAVKTIVPQVSPRKMVKPLLATVLLRLLKDVIQIIVHASHEATETLIESCANIRAMTKDIYAPAAGETIQIGQHTSTFSISLSDELLLSVKMSRVRKIFLKTITCD
jgi:cleavage and polyadenylation specificity factor subunit 2